MSSKQVCAPCANTKRAVQLPIDQFGGIHSRHPFAGRKGLRRTGFRKTSVLEGTAGRAGNHATTATDGRIRSTTTTTNKVSQSIYKQPDRLMRSLQPVVSPR